MDIKDRYRGMLWGLVVGDCLGSPIKSMPKEGHPYIDKMLPCAQFQTPAGYWTEDSSLAFCIMDSVIRKKAYDIRSIANSFVRWLEKGFLSSKERVAFDVSDNLLYGILAYKNTGSYSNGRENGVDNAPLGRLAPAYILQQAYPSDNVIYELSDLTHCNDSIHETIDKMGAILASHCDGIPTNFRTIYKSREEVDNSCLATATLNAALWAFQTTDNFRDGMLAAVNLGGEADSIGAVYGQIAGAYYGYDAIPQVWIEKILSYKGVDKFVGDFLATVDALRLASGSWF